VGETIHQEDFMSLLSNLASGSKNAIAFKNLIAYYDKYDERPDKVGDGEAKPEQIELYVHFFGQDYLAGLYHKVKGTLGTWTTHKDQFIGRTKVGTETFPAEGDIVLMGGRARAAKLIIKTGVRTKGVREVSKRTKLPYLNYGGTSGSVPFGRKNGTDEELTAFNDIVSGYKVQGKIPAGTRLSRIKEKI
jgi:hypothetical protein